MFERKIFKSSNGQWRITIPPQLIDDLDIEHGETVKLESVKRGVPQRQIKIQKVEEDE